MPHPTASAPADPGTWAAAALDRDRAAGLLRAPRRRSGGSGTRAMVDGRSVTVLSSNDYLGLAAHPEVRAAAAAAALRDGAGATGSRHLSGCHDAVEALEAELADFEGSETATVAPSGYAANLAVLQALGGEDAVVYSDARNHASIVDGCRLSRSRVEVYAHGDLDDLDARLRAREPGLRALVVSDTVFSMDGTVADVRGLNLLAERHGAWLVLDEAHATGVVGAGGRGAAWDAGIDADAPHLVKVVTLSKALGAAGGAVCARREVRGMLLQRGRALVFSTAPPHPTVAAARAALQTLRREPALVDTLRARTATLRRALATARPAGRGDIPIVPIPAPSPATAVAWEAALLERGFLVQAVRPPSVPPGGSRLRLVATAAHDDADLEEAAGAILAVTGR